MNKPLTMFEQKSSQKAKAAIQNGSKSCPFNEDVGGECHGAQLLKHVLRGAVCVDDYSNEEVYSTMDDAKYDVLSQLDEALDEHFLKYGQQFVNNPDLKTLDTLFKLVTVDLYCDKHLDEADDDLMAPPKNGQPVQQTQQQQQGNAPTGVPADAGGQAPAAQTPQGQSLEMTYAKSDFVAGDEILFEDLLVGEQLGEFPSMWDLKSGSAEVASVGGENAIHMEVDTRILPLMKEENYLPDEFTIEFDLFVQKGLSNNSRYNIDLVSADGTTTFQISFYMTSSSPRLDWGKRRRTQFGRGIRFPIHFRGFQPLCHLVQQTGVESIYQWSPNCESAACGRSRAVSNLFVCRTCRRSTVSQKRPHCQGGGSSVRQDDVGREIYHLWNNL